MDALKVVLATLKSKVSPLFNKLRPGLKPSRLKNGLPAGIRSFTKRLLDVRPAAEEDYYTLGRWYISKKLAVSIVLLTGLCSLCCIIVLKPETPPSAAGQIKTYRYNALPLQFIKGEVGILAKSGYLAYLGEISEGAVNGNGTLYAPDGHLVYRGGFKNNQYNGQGKRYHANNVLWYEGDFTDNQFDGEGALYRENGTLEYEGGFAAGRKDGKGILYNGSESKIYEGSFRRDFILYEELLHKTAAELSSAYTGKSVVYTSEREYCVYLPEISALYRAHGGEDTLDGEWKADGIYVLQSEICMGGEVLNSIPKLSSTLGAAVYEGNTKVTMPEAVAMNVMAAKGEGKSGQVAMNMTALFEDCYQVEEYDTSRLAYLYRFDAADCLYTFFCREKNGGFDFYLIEAKEG